MDQDKDVSAGADIGGVKLEEVLRFCGEQCVAFGVGCGKDRLIHSMELGEI